MLARLLPAFALFLPLSAAAEILVPEGRIAVEDEQRLAAFDKARAEAVAAAEAGGEAEYLTELEKVLAGDPQPIDRLPKGAYRCRSAQLGGILPVVVYGWFKCKVDEQYVGTHLVKLTGSQRFDGHLVGADGSYLLFWGAGHYADEQPRRYGRDPERDMIGRLVKVGPDRYRLELPLPKFDSRFEIIELQKN